MESHPPAVQMVQLLSGFQVSQALYVAAKLEIADRLIDGPVSVEKLASELDCDPRALSRLLRTLASLGVFTEVQPDAYGSTPLGATLMSDGEGSMRELALMWMETHYAPFAGLLGTVRTGRPAATEYYGRPFFAWLADHSEQVGRFSRAMADLTSGIKVGAIAGYDWSGCRRIVDVGGADGTLLVKVLRSAPDATGIVFDLPHVVEQAAVTMKGHDLGERLSAVGGDFFEAVPAGADVYLLSMVLHDWDDADAVRILANIRSAAPVGARVVALELVMPAGDQPHMSKMIDLTMLGMVDGRERTEGEMRGVFEAAGLTFDGAVSTPTPLSIVAARIPPASTA